jgi:ATP adenylyltransferase
VSYEQLWAPWRLGYIIGDKSIDEPCDPAKLLPGADPTCFLCQAMPEGDDRRRLIVERGEHTITILNRYPYNNGHILLAPRQHVARLDDLGDAAERELSQQLARLVNLLEKTMQPQGFNVGLNLGRAAGAGVPGHLHWHIVPRWIGDTNFMPAVAAVNCIPQALDALWELLTAESTKDKECLRTR